MKPPTPAGPEQPSPEQDSDFDERDVSQTKRLVGTYAQVGPYMSAGTQFAASIILCMLGGWWLDEKFSTTPLLLVAGVVLGAVAGFYNLYRTLVSSDRKPDSKRGQDDSSGGPAEKR